MSATIIQFPARKKAVETAYKIPLFGDSEVKLTVAAINLFGDQISGVMFTPATPNNLKTFSPEFVIACLKKALASDMFSSTSNQVLRKILRGIEEVKVS